MGTRRGSNSRPLHCERSALPAELRAQSFSGVRARPPGRTAGRKHEKRSYHAVLTAQRAPAQTGGSGSAAGVPISTRMAHPFLGSLCAASLIVALAALKPLDQPSCQYNIVSSTVVAAYCSHVTSNSEALDLFIAWRGQPGWFQRRDGAMVEGGSAPYRRWNEWSSVSIRRSTTTSLSLLTPTSTPGLSRLVTKRSHSKA